MMTPKEFAAKMRELCEASHGDAEGAHCDADRLMCEVLRQLGYGEGADVFEADDFIAWRA